MGTEIRNWDRGLIAGLLLSAGTLVAVGCSDETAPFDDEGADSVVTEEIADHIVLSDGCYTFTPLPDSVFAIETDLDWPREVRWRDRRGEGDHPLAFSADALDLDWGSLASPLGRGDLVPPDSVMLIWGGQSYRLRVMVDGGLSGIAVLLGAPAAGIPDEVVGELAGFRTPCSN